MIGDGLGLVNQLLSSVIYGDYLHSYGEALGYGVVVLAFHGASPGQFWTVGKPKYMQVGYLGSTSIQGVRDNRKNGEKRDMPIDTNDVMIFVHQRLTLLVVYR